MESFLTGPVWDSVLFGNTYRAYVTALVAFVVILAIFKALQVVALSRLKKLSEKTKTDIDDLIVAIIGSIKPPLYSFAALYFALRFLIVADIVQKGLDIVLLAWFTYQGIHTMQVAVDHVVNNRIKEDASSKNAAKFLSGIIKVFLWVIGGLLVLQNLGINVTSLVAGLGIGGIAVALAVQNVLSDLFSSFAIFFDKPFEVGDTITIGDMTGKVEKIGIKSTRLRSLQGEEIVISNKELTTIRIQNFKRLRERRITFRIGVVYETHGDKLKEIPAILERVVNSVQKTRFERAHFVAFNESSLDFETTFYVESQEYGEALDVRQEINYKIFDTFAELGIGMAYPTRTIYVQK